uniref:helix-turn-helix domain-containing protein n=1 Tax=Paenibacillus sabuli TaxID=2772509 RepID=UPI001CC2C6E1
MSHFVARIRTNQAKELLKRSDLKIEQIAKQVGFISSNSFIASFKKMEGITPGKYRAIYPE